MTTTLDENIEALNTACPKLYEQVKASLAANGRVSQFEKNAHAFDSGSIPATVTAEIVVICGFSSGRYAGSFLRNTPESTFIIVVEENLALFVQTLTDYPVRNLILSARVKFSVNEDGPAVIRKHIEDYSGFLLSSKILLVKDPGSARLNSRYYKEIEKSIDDLKSVARLNRRTIEYFSGEWNRHILMNLRHIFSCKGVGRLFGKFNGVPAVVVSAGPSLDKNIKWLKRLGANAVIISVDSAFKVLIDNGVPVHFVLCIDSQEKNFSHIEEVVKNPGESVLVVNPVTYPAIPDLFDGHIMLMTYNNPLMNWIEEHAGVFGETLVGGSVSTSAFDFARKLGCSPVVISGQDLSYESERAYVTGAWYSGLFEKSIRHDNSMEILNRKYVCLNGTRKIKNSFGCSVRSNDEMLSWKSWYEAVSSPGGTINSTEGGVSINGFSMQALHETAFALRFREFPIRRIIRECVSEESSTGTASLITGLHKYRNSLSVVTETSAKGLRCCSEIARLLKDGDFFPEVANKKLQILHSFSSSILKEKTFIETNQWDINLLLDKMQAKGSSDPAERLDSYKLLFRGMSELSKTRAADLDAGLKKIQKTLDLDI